MDPLSAAFAAYLDTVSTTVTNSMEARRNLDMQAHVVEHDGYWIAVHTTPWLFCGRRKDPESVLKP